jgi:hypothetical protein
MTEDELRTVFKPDRYGFCRVEVNGRVQGFWFDTVLRVNGIINEAKQ